MTLAVLSLLFGLAVGAAILIKSHFDQASARKEFSDDPAQKRLATHVEKYIYSQQDDAAYRALADGVRGEFELMGVASPERVRTRLTHAAESNQKFVKSGLRKKPSPGQTLGAANAIIRLSEEI